MKKRLFTIIVTILLALSMALPAAAEEGKVYVVDQLGVVSEQLTELNQKASNLSDSFGINVTLLMINTTGGAGTPDMSEQMYQASFGDSDGLMLAYSQEEKEWYIYKSGKAEELFTSEDEEALWSAFVSGEYYDDCVNGYLDTAQSQLTAKLGEPEKTDTIPDARLLPRLTDEADLLTDAEEEELLAKLDEISERQQCDVVVATVNSLGGKSAMEYADDFYDYNGFGYGENHDGIILLISMENRDWWMSTCGYGITAFTDSKQESMYDEFLPLLSDGDYAASFTKYAELCDEILTKAKSGSSGSSSDDSLSPIWYLIDLAVGFIIAFIMASIKKSKLKTVRRKAAAHDYEVEGSFILREHNDRFVTKTVTTRTIERDDSDTHYSSSGTEHGGSGGSF